MKLPKNSKKRSTTHQIENELKAKVNVTEEFQLLLNQLTLEEVIFLKLTSSAKLLKGKLYLPFFHTVDRLVKESVVKFAYCSTDTDVEASALLGISLNYFRKLKDKYNLKNYLKRINIKTKYEQKLMCNTHYTGKK
tara:strand:- start:1780 stop:2187 length:408 start_codon:yes stop_codon:yes gene_type:complete